MRCSNCHREVPDGAAFCPHCNCPVSPGVPLVCPTCGYPPANPNSMNCPYCHNPLRAPIQQQAPSNLWAPAPKPAPAPPQPAPAPTPAPPKPAPAPAPAPAPKPAPAPAPKPKPAPMPAPASDVINIFSDAPANKPSTPEDKEVKWQRVVENLEKKYTPTFELLPMQSPTMAPTQQGITFKGEKVELNGQNLSSPMIDAACQAIVTRDADGQWTIDDGSKNKSTFMLVTRSTPLRDGDVILLGGNLYQFHTNEQ